LVYGGRKLELFFVVFVPGMLACWLWMRNRSSWVHAIIGMVIGTVVSYGVIYVLGNYVQADMIAQSRQQFGDQFATQMTNALYGNALKYAVFTIIACAIALKLKKNSAETSK